MFTKVIATMLCAGLLSLTNVPGAVEDIHEPTKPEICSEAEANKYAYMDLETAPEELRETILAAREYVIYHTDGWVADGCYGFVMDVRTGEILEEVPEFHEIFPEDWEIPKEEGMEKTSEATDESSEYDRKIFEPMPDPYMELPGGEILDKMPVK